MKKHIALFTLIFIFMLSGTASISKSEENTWLARDWLAKGNGWAEMGIVRANGNDKGSLIFGIAFDSVGSPYVVSLDIKAELNISRFNIEAWEFSESTILGDPIPVPEVEPTASNPFYIKVGPFNNAELGDAVYELWIESSSRGRMKLKGVMRGLGIEFDLENVLWQRGTPEPSEPDNESGCNSVSGLSALLFLVVFKKHIRK